MEARLGVSEESLVTTQDLAIPVPLAPPKSTFRMGDVQEGSRGAGAEEHSRVVSRDDAPARSSCI